MKNIFAILIGFLTVTANAKTFVCISRSNGEWGQQYVAGNIKSATKLDGVNYGHRNATNGSANAVYIKNASAAADTNYNPIKFKGLNRFELGSFDDGDGGTAISILLPKNLTTVQANVKFTGFMIGKSGSGGGNIEVACFIR